MRGSDRNSRYSADGKRGRVMYKDDETRRVLYEVLLEQCFEKMSEEEKVKWIRKDTADGKE